MIWKQQTQIDILNSLSRNSLNETLGITFTEIGTDFLKATMSVSAANVQPFRILHGGASVCLAESLGSVASLLCLENMDTHTSVGIEINANHLKSVKEGDTVTGVCKPIRIGRNIHVWQIDISDSAGNLTCVSRLTVGIVAR